MSVSSPYQLKPRGGRQSATFFLLRSSCHDDDIALASFLVGARTHERTGGAMIGSITEILNVGISDDFLWVNKQNLTGDGLVDEGVCDRGAHRSGADDRNAGSQDRFWIRHFKKSK